MLLGVVLLLGTGNANASSLEVQVKGLFAGAAVLSIDGREQLLRKGQESEEGVVLVDADSDKAIISIGDEQRTLFLSNHIASSFESPALNQVHIKMAANRQYITSGTINGYPVNYLVDTGANIVALNAKMARALGISVEGGQKMATSTASDNVVSTKVIIKEMEVGGIKRTNIEAVVLDGEQPKDILLGMTFLQHVDINENSGLMVLTSKM
jgi:aspartyl protease family protein